MEVIAPNAVMLRPKAGSSTMMGATGFRELRGQTIAAEEERGRSAYYESSKSVGQRGEKPVAHTGGRG